MQFIEGGGLGYSEDVLKGMESTDQEMNPIKVRVDITLDHEVYEFLLDMAKSRGISFEQALAAVCLHGYHYDMKW